MNCNDISTGDDCLIISAMPAVKYSKEKKESRKLMQKNGEIILCRTFPRKQKRYSDTIFKKPDLFVRNVATARLLPCCSRDICVKNLMTPKYGKYHEKKVRVFTMVKIGIFFLIVILLLFVIFH